VKEYDPQDIRNVGLVSHQSIGKTSLAEAILFTAGITTRLGRVEDGTTTSDYSPDEISRKISISASLMNLEWNKKKINLIDMPGYNDFIGEVKCGLRVTDFAVVLINGVEGIEVGTELAMEILDSYNCPRMFFVNLLDRDRANYDKVLDDLKKAYTNTVAVQLPVNAGEGFNSIIDLLTMKKVTYQDDGSGKTTISDIPGELTERAEALRMELIEKIAESDDTILEKYFEAGELSDEDIVIGLTAGIANGTVLPVLCGAATKNIGASLLLDFIASYGPSPQTRSPIAAKDDKGEDIQVATDVKESFAALAFKTFSELHVGELSLIRVYSGCLKSGDEVYNTSRNVSEKIGQIYSLNGKNRAEIGVLCAGDIGALVKLKDTHTGNTLSDKKKKIFLPGIEFPVPVVDVAISPKSKGDEEKISNGLHTIHEIDPSFVVRNDPELRQTVISGQGELHLNVIIQRLKERFGVDVTQKKPRIPYRETITAKADEKYRHKKQSGGAGQFAEVWMRIEPLARGEGFAFASAVVGGAISSSFIPSIEKGVKQVLEEGAVAGYRIVDVKAVVYDGKEHPVDSKDIAFQIAGREVFKMAVKNARPILLEPIYQIEVKCPEDNMGDVMGDLSSRRGKISGMESQGRFQVVKALVPLAELHNYATTLRSMTQGRATYTRQLSHYDPVPKELEARIIQESQQES
jgi:elongation factor G